MLLIAMLLLLSFLLGMMAMWIIWGITEGYVQFLLSGGRSRRVRR